MLFEINLPYQKRACCLQTIEKDIISFITTYYGQYCHSADSVIGFLINLYKIGGTYFIETCDGLCKTFCPQKTLVDIISKAGGIRDEYLLLHGMVVVVADKAHVFLAHTHGGKSTLSALLLHRGFQILAEDTVIIEKQTGLLIPLSMPIRLRKGGKKVLLRTLKTSVSLAKIYDGHEERYLIVLNPPQKEKYEIQNIIFSMYGVTNTCISVTANTDCIGALIGAVMSSQIFDAATLSTLNKLSKVNTHIMEYTDEQYVIDCLIDNFE